MLNRESNNSQLFNFYYEFLDRHDFNDEDINILQKKYPNVKFNHIPQAWIICIDEMLEDIYSISDQLSLNISERFGFLDVQFIPHNSELNYAYELIIKEAERKIYLIDVDLHMNLEYKEWWMAT